MNAVRNPSKGRAPFDKAKQQGGVNQVSETLENSSTLTPLHNAGLTSPQPAASTREDIVLGLDDDADQRESEEESPSHVASLPGAFPAESPKKVQKAAGVTSLPGSFPSADTTLVEKMPSLSPLEPAQALDLKPATATAPVSVVVPKELAIPTGLRTTVSCNLGPDPKGIAKDTYGFLSSPPKPAQLQQMPRKLSKSSGSSKPVKNMPWVWHQDGFIHQRLESHQILTKEQVFEQFHLDLEQEGPNGFFLFKLVKRFKKQDNSTMAMTNALLGAELSASPTACSPSTPTATPTSLLESLEAVSVSQRLKRQLLLQKRKKQRKSSSSDSEEDDSMTMEALLNMSQTNSSLQNLNSSLQEVIDAVDNLKGADEWSTILNRPRPLTHTEARPSKPSYPDSDAEYTTKDKEAMDVDVLEKKRGVYATGRHDGLNLLAKKKHKANQRRSSVSTSSRKQSSASASTPGSNSNGADQGPDSVERRGSDAVDPQFKKQAVSQLHIYSRNGLKFKFDVMEDNELHFVEASKKYTFMDPLAANRQPDLDINGDDGIAPLRSPSASQFPNGASNSNSVSSSRRPSSGTVATLTNDSIGRPAPRRSSSSRSKSTISSASANSRRVFVTRLGRHTLLTYGEYKVLARSASSFTLGAKLLIQRSMPSFYGHGKDSSQVSTYDATTPTSPTKSTFSSSSSSTPSNNPENPDYFSAKKKPRAITGFASKAVAAIKSPTQSSPSSSQGNKPRPIVTPYNPNDYKNKALTVTAATNGGSDEGMTPDTPFGDSSLTPQTPNRVSTPGAEPFTPTPGTPSTPSNSSSANPYGSIKRQGNQAGLKFQHLFVTVHQRLQKLELENGASFYGSGLVQWTVVEDPAELRWWRDKIGIQMIGRLEGDVRPSTTTTTTGTTPVVTSKPLQTLQQSAFSSTISLRSSYVSAESSFSDLSTASPSTSSSTLSSGGASASSSATPFKSQVSVERLGYRFLRVSGYMGTLKVTVTEQVEARAVALAVRAEMIRQKRLAQQQSGGQVEEDPLEQPWVETVDATSTDHDGDISSDEFDEDERIGIPIDQPQKKNKQQSSSTVGSFDFYDDYEYDEVTGRTRLRKEPSVDRFSRRKRHDKSAAANKQKDTRLIERMTMIVGQTRAFKGDWYMKNVYKFYP